jgi:hypothetical protein
LRVNLAFANAPGNNLRVLRAKIQNDYLFSHENKETFNAF